MGKATIATEKKINILFIHRQDQNWDTEFRKLDGYENFHVKFIEDKDFGLTTLNKIVADIIVLPLTLGKSQSLEVAKQVQFQKKPIKLLLCSDTTIKDEFLHYLFDSRIRRTACTLNDMSMAIGKLAQKQVTRDTDDKTILMAEAYIIANESAFLNKNHGGISFSDVVHMKDNIKNILKYYLLFLLITMVSTVYPVVDSLYKQMDGVDEKDHAVLGIFVIPFIVPFIYTYHHHDIGGELKKREKITYKILFVLEILVIIFFVARYFFRT